MSHKLRELWEAQSAFLAGKSFRQIIQIAGDGRFRDDNETSTELREWLSVIPLERLRQCAEECLAASFDDSGFALQDVANEIGARLGFNVTPGRYRGQRNEIGNDGLWVGDDGFAVILEVKTTDTYRINLDTVAEYRRQLILSERIDESRSSVLIAVGRQDTGDLEAQIRGSHHAWDIRLISIDALLRLADVKEQLSDWSTSNKINRLLRPVEYTRLDDIVELLFATKQDLESSDPIAPKQIVDIEVPHPTISKGDLELLRENAIKRVAAALRLTFVRRGKALRSTNDGKTRLVCLASQQYEGSGGSSNYWYGFTRAQRAFLEDGEYGYLALACGGSQKIFLVERSMLFSWLPNLLTTPPEPSDYSEIRHWHIYFNDYGSHVDLYRSGGGLLSELSQLIVAE